MTYFEERPELLEPAAAYFLAVAPLLRQITPDLDDSALGAVVEELEALATLEAPSEELEALVTNLTAAIRLYLAGPSDLLRRELVVAGAEFELVCRRIEEEGKALTASLRERGLLD